MKILNIIRKQLWILKQKSVNITKNTLWYTKRKAVLLIRKIKPFKTNNTYLFAILCIKKTAYADLVIRQANSLHYFNPTHRFAIYADGICTRYLKENINKFDYPKQIEIKNAFGEAQRPWTHYKIEMRIENSKLGGVDIDADMFWHADPVLDRTRPLMFAPVFIFKDNEIQKQMILEVFKKPEWLEYTHFVSAFVSIPPQFMTEKMTADSRQYVKIMLEDPISFIKNQADKDEIRRVSEEIAICFALQSNYPGMTKPLKEDGGRKNKDLLETFYYGSENRIIT